MPSAIFSELVLDSSKEKANTAYAQIKSGEDDKADELINDLINMEVAGELNLDSDSVYGLAIAMPQMARSMPRKFFIALAARSYLLLFMNCFVQMSLLCFVGLASQIMAVLGGQMHLCDFGGALKSCPDGPGCVGPGGTKYTKSRLYGFDQWFIQTYVKKAMLDVLPEKAGLIDEKVDPGEYGMENWWCRLMACFLFTQSVVMEFYSCMDLIALLWVIPSEAESWIEFKELDEDAEESKKNTNSTFPSLDNVEFKVRGMPRHWKIINLIFVVFPKCFLWFFIIWQGMVLLLETAGILDLIFGSLAMAFICNVDELMLETLTSVAARHIMGCLESFRLPPRHKHVSARAFIAFVFPRRLVFCIIITAAFVLKYYWRKCKWDAANGMFVSKDMRYPASVTYWPWDLIDSTWISRDKEIIWSMPSAPAN